MSKQDFEQMEMINAFLSDKGKFTQYIDQGFKALDTEKRGVAQKAELILYLKHFASNCKLVVPNYDTCITTVTMAKEIKKPDFIKIIERLLEN